MPSSITQADLSSAHSSRSVKDCRLWKFICFSDEVKLAIFLANVRARSEAALLLSSLPSATAKFANFLTLFAKTLIASGFLLMLREKSYLLVQTSKPYLLYNTSKIVLQFLSQLGSRHRNLVPMYQILPCEHISVSNSQ